MHYSKTTEMVGNGNARKAKTTRASQHRMPTYNMCFKFFLKTGGVCDH